MPEEFLFRLQDSLSCSFDLEGEPSGPSVVKLDVCRFRILGRTPKGVWIDYGGSKRFVLSSAKRCFAHATMEEARQSFLFRKKRQIQILSGRLGNAKRALQLGEMYRTEEQKADAARALKDLALTARRSFTELMSCEQVEDIVTKDFLIRPRMLKAEAEKAEHRLTVTKSRNAKGNSHP